MSKKSNRFSPEVRQRAVRMVLEHRCEYTSLWATIESIAPKIGCVPQTLNDWVRQHEVDQGMRDGVSSDERTRIKGLEREVKELRKANEILKLASAFLCPGGAGPPTQVSRDFVDQNRQAYGVEPICKVLQIAPSGYRCHAARQRKPELLCVRAKRDEALMPKIQAVWQANMQVYGADKVWHQMNREGIKGARCTVERLMKRMGLHGVRRGKVIRTTVPDKAAPCPLDWVNRQFKADRPNQFWVSDFTYVSTWQGWQYVAFVIDVFARRIVGWRVSSSMHTDFVLDALEQALFDRQPERSDALIHHSDRGSQYDSILYTERLVQAGVEPSVGSHGDSYHNALAETINGLYKAELIHRRAPWKTKEALELATLEWVAWFNYHRLLSSVRYIPPAEAEVNCYRQVAGKNETEVST